ncbi:UNVERIFIED_CONTAM: hypothetical protein PYX00_003773 [Menopon gallinae]|uniref:Peptidylprolyl isomerase n=1 Tax=Menopon gallinae TaxID=328185 RepID=A0AAW2I3U8_9NEOP
MNDDDTDFTPNKNTSKLLNSLFGDNRPRTSGNQSLIYVPPKAPRPNDNSTTPRDSTSGSARRPRDISVSKRDSDGKYVSSQQKAQERHESGGKDAGSVCIALQQRKAHIAENVSPKHGSVIKSTRMQKRPAIDIFFPNNDSNLGTASYRKFELISAYPVQLFKFEQNNYVNLGPGGIFLVRNLDLHLYQIYLKNQTNYINKVCLSTNFVFTVMENNYASFYDDVRQNWSILFSTQTDVQDFAKEVAIAKYNSQLKPEKMIVQDLAPLPSHTTKPGDIIRVKYFSYIMTANELVPHNEDLAVIDIGEHNPFPWVAGLHGCGLNCKRLVILPNKLAAPWSSNVQSESSVILELEVQSIISRENIVESEQNMIVSYEVDQPRSASEPMSDRHRKRDRKSREGIDNRIFLERQVEDEIERELAEEDIDGTPELEAPTENKFILKSHRQDIISRIARMGQPLPLPSSASEPEKRAVEFSEQQPHNLMIVKSHTEGEDYQSRMAMLDSDYRTTRMARPDSDLTTTINKVMEKVDDVLNKSATGQDPLSVISTINIVITENENLKSELHHQRSQIEEQDEKIQELLDITQRYIEKLADANSPTASEVASKFNDLESKLQETENKMNAANYRIFHLSSIIDKYKREITQKERQIGDRNAALSKLEDKLRTQGQLLQSIEMAFAKSAAENKILTNLNEKQKVEISKFNQPQKVQEGYSSGKSTPVQNTECEAEIKKVMNAVNKKLQMRFEPGKFYSGQEIKDTIATTIKDVTIDYLLHKSMNKAPHKTTEASKAEAVSSKESGKTPSISSGDDDSTITDKTEGLERVSSFVPFGTTVTPIIPTRRERKSSLKSQANSSGNNFRTSSAGEKSPMMDRKTYSPRHSTGTEKSSERNAVHKAYSPQRRTSVEVDGDGRSSITEKVPNSGRTSSRRGSDATKSDDSRIEKKKVVTSEDQTAQTEYPPDGNQIRATAAHVSLAPNLENLLGTPNVVKDESKDTSAISDTSQQDSSIKEKDANKTTEESSVSSDDYTKEGSTITSSTTETGRSLESETSVNVLGIPYDEEKETGEEEKGRPELVDKGVPDNPIQDIQIDNEIDGAHELKGKTTSKVSYRIPSISDYYRQWESMHPPPLPSDSESGNDEEEWL